MSRREDRAAFDIPTRVTLAETDLDHQEQRLDHHDEKAEGQQKLIIATLATFSLTALGIAVKIALDALAGR